MKLIKFGKIVNTHGLRGELKISSNSDFKNERLKKGSKLVVDDTEYFVNTWRTHKNHELVTFEGFPHINDVEFLKGSDVFVEVEDETDEYIPNLIGMRVIDQNDNEIGKIVEITTYPMYDILVITGEKRYLIPFIDKFIMEQTKEYIKVELLPGMGE